MNNEYLRRLPVGFSIAIGVHQVAPCFSFSDSVEIDNAYLTCPKTEGFPNPWHIGTLDSSEYPDPHELLQGELELLVMMFSMVVELKPHLVFESGTNVGLMARALAAGCWVNGFGRVVTCDTDLRMVEYARKVCEGLPVEILHEPALSVGELAEADLLFIDSSEDSRVQEISLIKPGAVYVMHDTHAEQWMRDVVDDSEEYRVHIPGPRGFSIARKA